MRGKRKLIETAMAAAVLSNHGIDDAAGVYQSLLDYWCDHQYGALSVLLSAAQATAGLHQTHHWQAKSDPFYGDHLLFERIYGVANEDIDALAEKVVGLGDASHVPAALRFHTALDILTCSEPDNVLPSPTQLVERSLFAEVMYLNFASMTHHALEECGLMTRGLDNMLAGIEDKHEGSVYLLKQRLTNS